MMAKIAFSVLKEGPFFELKGQPLKDAGADMIRDLLKEGEAKVLIQLYPGHGVETGRYKNVISTHFVRSQERFIGWGKVTGISKEEPRSSAIVGRWLEGGVYRGSPGARRFKGYHMFRNAAAHVNKLARQMAGRHYARAVQRLT